MRTPLAHVLPFAALMPQSLKNADSRKGQAQHKGNQQNGITGNHCCNGTDPSCGSGKDSADACQQGSHGTSLNKTFFQKFLYFPRQNAVEIELM